MAKKKPEFCGICGRLDPWQLKPCYCQRTKMEEKEKDVRLFYEHHVEGHPFGVKGCPGCEGDKIRDVV